MEFLIIGMATAMNVLIIKWKVEKKRYEDAIFDGAVLIGLSLVFSGTYGGLVVATIASAIISLFLIASPPKFVIGGVKNIFSDEIDGKPV
jgi:hypothetical protein